MQSIDDEYVLLGHGRVPKHQRLKEFATVVIYGCENVAVEAPVLCTAVARECGNVVEIEKRDEIKNADINNLTPVEALNKLNEIKKLSGLQHIIFVYAFDKLKKDIYLHRF